MPCGSIVVIGDGSEFLRGEGLTEAGFELQSASTGLAGLGLVAREKPDLILLHLTLPDMTGFEVCRRLQQEPVLHPIPVIALGRSGGESDEVLILGIGADDYLSGPVSPRVLLARIEAVLRRVRSRPATAGLIRQGDICLDAGSHEVRIHGKDAGLTATEFRLLHCLACRPGQVLSRRQLINLAIEEQVSDRTVDVHVRSIRRKLGSAAHQIETVRGVGYRIKNPG